VCKAILLSAALWFASGQVQAQQAGLTSLACKGTKTTSLFYPTEKEEKEPISMGIIVDLNAGTVQGFSFNYPVMIEHADDAKNPGSLATLSSGQPHPTSLGTIDRVTGEVEAWAEGHILKTGTVLTATTYALQCKPTQRVF
jgi:hypothetical protein